MPGGWVGWSWGCARAHPRVCVGVGWVDCRRNTGCFPHARCRLTEEDCRSWLVFTACEPNFCSLSPPPSLLQAQRGGLPGPAAAGHQDCAGHRHGGWVASRVGWVGVGVSLCVCACGRVSGWVLVVVGVGRCEMGRQGLPGVVLLLTWCGVMWCGVGGEDSGLGGLTVQAVRQVRALLSLDAGSASSIPLHSGIPGHHACLPLCLPHCPNNTSACPHTHTLSLSPYPSQPLLACSAQGCGG